MNPDMSFGSCQLIDEITQARYVSREGNWPITMLLGGKVGTSFLCENSGDVALFVRVYIEIRDPDGVGRASAWLPPLSRLPADLNPGVGYYSEYIDDVILDKSGLWLIYGRLNYGTVSSSLNYNKEITWNAIDAIEGGGNGEPPNGGGGVSTIPWQWIGLGVGAIAALFISRRGKSKK